MNTWALYGLTASDAIFFDDTPDLRVDQYPVFRRFYEGHPLRHNRHVSRFWEIAREASEARRAMRENDRRYRPDLADELELSQENAEYDQMQNAREQMGAIRNEMERVREVSDLSELHDIADDRAKAIKKPSVSRKWKRPKVWRDMGALKAALLDSLLQERNDFAESVVRDVEAQREGAEQ